MTLTASSTWSKVFPVDVGTIQKSVLFIKKLTAVAVSNITYLRCMCPEKAYGDRYLDDLRLKILREDTGCPRARQIIQWMKGCFDAIEKQYLKMIIFGIYSAEQGPDNMIESYSFKISYGNDTTVEVLRNDVKVDTVSSELDNLKYATRVLLRKLLVLIQSMDKLPQDAVVTMKLLYYDETPEDYEPPGFRPSESDIFVYEDCPKVTLRVGELKTPFHALKMRVRTNADIIIGSKDNEETTNSKHKAQPAQTKPMGVQQILPHPQQSFCRDFNSPATADRIIPAVPDSIHGYSADNSHLCENNDAVNNIVDMDNGDRCACGVHEDDGLMVLCHMCKYWQHGICFMIRDETEAPREHICDRCGSTAEPGRQPTDMVLHRLTVDQRKDLCLWRRALMACTEMETMVPLQLARRLGITTSVACGIINKLLRENIVKHITDRRDYYVIDQAQLTKDKLAILFVSTKSAVHQAEDHKQLDLDVSQRVLRNRAIDNIPLTTTVAIATVTGGKFAQPDVMPQPPSYSELIERILKPNESSCSSSENELFIDKIWLELPSQ